MHWLTSGRTVVIAEAGVNHNGDLAQARRLVQVAAEAGADAVKFQTFKAERLVTADAAKAAYQKRATQADETQLEMLRRLELSDGAHRALMACAREHRIRLLSTPFDEECADFLDRLGVGWFKIPSGELTNLSFLRHVAGKGKPMIVSTGMATLGEVEAAVATVRAAGNGQIALLQCASNYPADPADVNLRAMHTLAAAFGVPVGFSDHTLGIEVALAAVALGACIIEKHFTLDRSLPGPDHAASLEPAELRSLVNGIRKVEASLGDGCKRPVASEADTAAVRKSLVAIRAVRPGQALTAAMVGVKRPGTGLAPALLPHLLGRKARRAVPAGTLLQLDQFA